MLILRCPVNKNTYVEDYMTSYIDHYREQTRDLGEVFLEFVYMIYEFVYSALRVTPTHLEPRNEGTTTTTTTSTTRVSDINMLTTPKQTTHKRELPTIFEGNKPEQNTLGPTTTFKNWSSEVQTYMSLEDYNLAAILERVKQQTVPITDANYIDYELHQQGLGQEDEEDIKENELRKL
eukprot:2649659-Amphidinium_carterae.1